MQIPGFKRIGFARLMKHAFQRFAADDMEAYGAAVTFHLLLSLFPFLIFFIALLGFLELSELFDWLRRRSEAFFLEQTLEQANQLLDQIQRRRVGILSFGAVVALWASSSALRAVMKALNIVYSVKEERPAWKRYMLSLVYTVVVGVMLMIATSLVLVSPRAIQAVAEGVGVLRVFAELWAWWLRWPALVILLTATVALIYGMGPDAQQRFRFVTTGAFFVVTIWMLISLMFSFYVRRIIDFNQLYGSMGSIIVLLLYFYICSLTLLFGAEINAVLEHHAPAGKNAGEKSLHE